MGSGVGGRNVGILTLLLYLFFCLLACGPGSYLGWATVECEGDRRFYGNLFLFLLCVIQQGLYQSCWGGAQSRGILIISFCDCFQVSLDRRQCRDIFIIIITFPPRIIHELTFFQTVSKVLFVEAPILDGESTVQRQNIIIISSYTPNFDIVTFI